MSQYEASERELAASLVSAKSGSDQNTLLEAESELITVEQPDDSVMKQSCRFAHSVHARAVGITLGPIVLAEEIIEAVAPGRIRLRAAGIEHSAEVHRVLIPNGADGVGGRWDFGANDKGVSMANVCAEANVG